MTIKTAWQTVMVEDGEMRLYTARPEGAGPFPGFLVLQEAFGVNHHIRALTERIAAAGFVAVSPELYHRAAPGFESGYEGPGFQKGIDLLQTLTVEGLEADLRATYDWLINDAQVDATRVAVTGYCMGGRASYIANAILPLQAAVSYYGGGIPALLDRAADQHAPILFCWGGQDDHIGRAGPRQVEDAMLAAGKPFVTAMFAAAGHGFACDERGSYHPDAAAQAWALMLQFVRDNLR